MSDDSRSPNDPVVPSPGGPRTSQVVLGVFICWQIWFLFSQNFFGFIEDSHEYIEDKDFKKTLQLLAPDFMNEDEKRRGHVHDLAAWVTRTNKPWMQISGQLQSWALFSGCYYSCGFPSLVLLWDDTDPLTVPWPREAKGIWWSEGEAREGTPPPMYYVTPHEPRDPNSYFRWWQMRMRRYETAVIPLIDHKHPEYQDPKELKSYYERRINNHLENKGYLTTVYLKHILRDFERQFPKLPRPKQVLLLQRAYRTKTPPAEAWWMGAPRVVEGREVVEDEMAPPFVWGPETVPMLLWHPPARGEEGQGTYRKYHPPSNSFKSW